jgi:hypothetical protein
LGVADTTTLNSALFTSLAAEIRTDGAIPVLVYLPRQFGDDALAHDTLRMSGLSYLDMEVCLSRVPESDRRVRSVGHYSGTANRAIAMCTAPAVRCALEGSCERPLGN